MQHSYSQLIVYKAVTVYVAKALYPSLPHSFFHSHGKESRILHSNFFSIVAKKSNLHGRPRYGAMNTQDFCTGIKVLP